MTTICYLPCRGLHRRVRARPGPARLRWPDRRRGRRAREVPGLFTATSRNTIHASTLQLLADRPEPLRPAAHHRPDGGDDDDDAWSPLATSPSPEVPVHVMVPRGNSSLLTARREYPTFPSPTADFTELIVDGDLSPVRTRPTTLARSASHPDCRLRRAPFRGPGRRRPALKVRFPLDLLWFPDSQGTAIRPAPSPGSVPAGCFPSSPRVLLAGAATIPKAATDRSGREGRAFRADLHRAPFPADRIDSACNLVHTGCPRVG